eukprot:gene7657-9162_t
MLSGLRLSFGAVARVSPLGLGRTVKLTTQKRCLSKIATPSSRRGRLADPIVKAEIISEVQAEEEMWDVDFDAEVNKILTKVNDAVVPMIELNEGFSVEFAPSEPSLTIITMKGKLSLTVDKDQALLNLQSFLSGAQHYYFDAEEREWLSKRDSHSLRGVVTRDLIRHSRGCPDLDDKN